MFSGVRAADIVSAVTGDATCFTKEQMAELRKYVDISVRDITPLPPVPPQQPPPAPPPMPPGASQTHAIRFTAEVASVSANGASFAIDLTRAGIAKYMRIPLSAVR